MSEKILLIDDEVDFLSVMSERMAARKMRVSTAASAKEGLEKVATSISKNRVNSIRETKRACYKNS